MNRSLLASLFFGVLATIFVMKVTAEARAGADYGALRSTVMATRDILEGELIDDEALTIGDVPLSLRQPNAVADPARVVDRVARVPIAQGEQILETKLTTGPVRSISELLPEGQRAFTLDVAGGVDPRLLTPGDVVDVIAVFESGAGGGDGRSRSAGPMKVRTILQARTVLAVGDLYPGSPRGVRLKPNERRRARGGTAGGRPGRRQVTLAVTAADAQSLGLASETSELYLALRGRYTDEGAVPLPPLSTPDLFQETVRRKRTRWSVFDDRLEVP